MYLSKNHEDSALIADETRKQFFDHYAPHIPAGAWLDRIFYGLYKELFTEYDELVRAATQGSPISSIAFHTRNLFELWVWTHHCLADDKNAKKLYDDAARDGRDLLDRHATWAAEAGSTNAVDSFNDAKDRLSKAAAASGVDDINGNYDNVGQIAKQYPELKDYPIAFKTLSKFAHPTALNIVGLPPKAEELKPVFFDQGCLAFTKAVVQLAKRLVSPRQLRLYLIPLKQKETLLNGFFILEDKLNTL